mmetsp:Transcript_19285/g.43743  ORF Transcript_19285/g.43743 Transcript_19285/m.43743 type:complete len:390 (-) Transcript_19285:927-2096(-)
MRGHGGGLRRRPVDGQGRRLEGARGGQGRGVGRQGREVGRRVGLGRARGRKPGRGEGGQRGGLHRGEVGGDIRRLLGGRVRDAVTHAVVAGVQVSDLNVGLLLDSVHRSPLRIREPHHEPLVREKLLLPDAIRQKLDTKLSLIHARWEGEGARGGGVVGGGGAEVVRFRAVHRGTPVRAPLHRRGGAVEARAPHRGHRRAALGKRSEARVVKGEQGQLRRVAARLGPKIPAAHVAALDGAVVRAPVAGLAVPVVARLLGRPGPVAAHLDHSHERGRRRGGGVVHRGGLGVARGGGGLGGAHGHGGLGHAPRRGLRGCQGGLARAARRLAKPPPRAAAAAAARAAVREQRHVSEVGDPEPFAVGLEVPPHHPRGGRGGRALDVNVEVVPL